MPLDSLPKFLVCLPCPVETAHCDDERSFVMHTQHPRFLMEFTPGGEGELLLLDGEGDDVKLEKLRVEARAFFCGECPALPHCWKSSRGRHTFQVPCISSITQS